MKKIAIAFFLCAAGFSAVPASASLIRIEVDFGNSGGCSGRGLCKIIIGRGTTAGNPSAELLTAVGRQLIIRVPEAYISAHQPEQMKNFLGKASFQLDGDFVADESTSRSLGALQPVVVKKGNYPMSLANGVYTITLPVSDK